MERAILHVDMDAFFASIEQRDRPELRGLPVIVGGSVEQRGVVSTASYEARRFGVHSAMPMAEAHRRCPHGVFLPVDMAKYRAVSRQIMEIFAQFTPDVEALSLDEAFLDLSGSLRLFGPAEEIGRTIKRQIRRQLRLTASVGLSYNKFLAKLASDLDKPDGFFCIGPDEIAEKVWPLPVSRMMGVGEKTAQLFEQLGVRTIGQLAALDDGLLEQLLGKQGPLMRQLARGIDPRPVEPVRACKSVGREMTFPQDIADGEQLETILFTLTDEVCHTLRSHDLTGKTVSLKLRYPDFHSITRAATLPRHTASFEPVFAAARDLLSRHRAPDAAVRLLGVTVSNLLPRGQVPEQQSLFGEDASAEKHAQLNQVIDRINAKYGSDTLRRARKLSGREKNGEQFRP